jgi:hypothetical protein
MEEVGVLKEMRREPVECDIIVNEWYSTVSYL